MHMYRFNKVSKKASTARSKTRSKTTPLAVIFASSLALVACGGGDSGNSTPNNTGNTNGNNSNTGNNNGNANTALTFNAGIAKDFVDNLAIPAYTNFASQSATLPTSIQTYCSAIGKANEAATKTAAQNGLIALKNAWQATTVYKVGPVSANSNNLANVIYTRNNFDASTASLIGAQVARRQADANYTLASNVTTKARGLDAIEYLLYQNATTNSSKLGNCNYAVVVANDVKAGANNIVSAWKAQRNSVLTNAESNGVDLIQPFFNNFANVIDVEIKSNDIAIPASLKSGGSCSTATCPELLENTLSKSSYGSIKAKLQGLKAVFNGTTTGKGFRAFYAQKNMSSEAQAFATLINNAIATIDAQNSSLYDQLAAIKAKNKTNACNTVAGTGTTTDTDLAPCKLYYQVKQISDEVKAGSFKLAVNLALPASAAGDGD